MWRVPRATHNTNNYFRLFKNEVLPASFCSSALASHERHILNVKQKRIVNIKKAAQPARVKPSG